MSIGENWENSQDGRLIFRAFAKKDSGQLFLIVKKIRFPTFDDLIFFTLYAIITLNRKKFDVR